MSVVCPRCGMLQQPRIVTRPTDLEYDRNDLGIKDDPHETDQRFVAYSDGYYSGGIWAVSKCLNTPCREVFLLTKPGRHFDWETAVIIPGADTAYLGETPDTVKSAIEQAKKCMAIGCADAAAAMCRAALDRMAKDKEAKGARLVGKLKDLLDNGLLTKLVYDAADKVRDWGNTALHELLEEPVDDDTARRLLTLTDLVARDLYVTPMVIRSLDTSEERSESEA